MNSADVAAIVTAIGVSTAAILTAIAAWMNARNGTKVSAAQQKQIDQQERENKQFRIDVIRMGEGMTALRSDNAKLALLVKQLFNQFEQATGHKPDVDLEMMAHMMEIYYITSPLGDIDIAAVKRMAAENE